MEDQNPDTARNHGSTIEIKRTGSTLTVQAATDGGFRTARKALRRIGADVENLGSYSVRAEFDGAFKARAVERLMQYAGARGVLNHSFSESETGVPSPPMGPTA